MNRILCECNKNSKEDEKQVIKRVERTISYYKICNIKYFPLIMSSRRPRRCINEF